MLSIFSNVLGIHHRKMNILTMTLEDGGIVNISSLCSAADVGFGMEGWRQAFSLTFECA